MFASENDARIRQIEISIENKVNFVLDEHGKKGEFKKDKRNRLVKHVGGYSVVFPYVASNGEKWAFRCWHTMKKEDITARCQTISETIKKSKLSFLSEFIYIDEGITVQGKKEPVSRMRWVEGLNLGV